MNNDSSSTRISWRETLSLRLASSLRVQFGAIMILMAVIPLLIVALVLALAGTAQIRNAMTESTLNHLDSVRAAKASEVSSYFDERESDMAALAETVHTLQKDAFDHLLSVQTVKKSQIEDYFQTAFGMVHALKDNPITEQALSTFEEAFETEGQRTGGAQWRAVEGEFGSIFVGVNDDFGFYDIFLITEDGDVVYTVLKELDLGENVLRGDLRDSGLGRVFQTAKSQESDVVVEDFAPYAPSGDAPAIFVASVIKNDTGRVIGVVAIQLPTAKINAIMQEDTGLGETGETYLIGPDKLFRSNSRFIEESVIVNPNHVVDTHVANEALAGNAGAEISLDHQGEYALSAYAPLDIAGLQWAILAEINVVEALVPRIQGADSNFFEQYAETYGYANVFLFLPDGHLFYSVENQNPDYQTNLLTGPYKDSHLGGMLAGILESQAYDVTDFAHYDPSGGEPALFVGAPVLHQREGSTEVELVVAAQVPMDQINTIMHEQTGLGEQGETYLVGTDNLFRSDSYFLQEEEGVESSILNVGWKVDTTAVRNALAAGPGREIIDNYLGTRVLSSWSLLTVDEPHSDDPEGLSWAVIAEMKEDVALEGVGNVTSFVLILTLGLVLLVGLLAVGVGYVVSNRLVKPIVVLTESAAAIASGDFDVSLPPAPGRSEVGLLTNSFAAMVARLREMVGTLQDRTGELAERTRDLEASQRVTFAASERTSPAELLGLVVDLIRDQFDLYHVQVYVVDEEQQAAVLRESTGYAGSQLLQAQHQIPLDSPALVTKAINEGQAVLVDDVYEDPTFMPNPLLPETRSELVVPLRIGERVFGGLDAQDRVSGRFSETTVALFQTMADQVAFLFENTELLTRVTEQTEALTIFTTQLRIAADIAEHLSSVLDPTLLLQQVVEMMQSRFGLYHAHIYVLDEAAGWLTVRAGSGEVGRVLSEEGHSIPLDREKSLVARAARNREAILVEDTALESDFMPNPLLPQTRSELAVPLVAGGQVLGVLDMQDDQAGRFTPSDVDTFSTLAGQIATSLQNANLFEQVEVNAQEAQLRFAVSQVLTIAQTEDQVLDVLVQQAGFYPQTRFAIYTFALESEERVIVLRRDEAFESGFATRQVGARYTPAQLPLMEHLSSDEPFVLLDVNTDGRVDSTSRKVLEQIGYNSGVSIPLTVGGEWMGFIMAFSAEKEYFDERKLQLYQTLAEQGATALQATRLRAEVERSEREYRELNAGLRDGVANIDMQRKFLGCNPAFEEMVGYSLAELQQMDITDLTPEKWHAMEAKILEEQAMTRGYTDLYEKEYVMKDGYIFPVELTAYLTHDEQGNPTGFWAYIRDITERKQAEEEQQRLVALVENSSEMIALADFEGKVLYMNEAGRQLVGLGGLEDAQATSIPEYFDPDDLSYIEQHVMPAVTEQGRWVGELDFRHFETGARLPVLYNVFTVQDSETGQPICLATVTRDIAERKRVEAEREQFTTQLRTAADLAERVNAILDPDELLSEVVDQLRDRFGIYHVHVYLLNAETRNLVMRAGSGEVGQIMLEQGHSIPLDREKSLVARAARTRGIVSVADTSTAPDFMPNPLLPETSSEVAVPLVAGDMVMGVFDVQDNQPGRFTPADLDIFSTLAGQIATALQNAGYVEQVETRLRVSQMLAGAETEDQVLDAIIRVADFDPKAQVSISTFDKEADEPTAVMRRIESFDSGIPASIEPGTRFAASQMLMMEHISPDEPFVLSNIQLDERADEMVREMSRQMGTVSMAIMRLQIGDEQIGTLTASSKEEGYFDERKLRLYQTVTEQGAIALRTVRLHEETKLVAERLHEVNQLKSEFMADMSHELRTPLNSIIGYTELMLMGISDMDPDTLEDIQAIYDNGRHLLQIINDILDLSKIEAGRMELNLEDVYVESLLDEIKTSNAGLLINKPVEMLTEVAEGVSEIEADRVRLSQILNNLIGNAIKFTEDGSIMLRAYNADEAGWVCLEVEDTGMGMDEDGLQEIFERYRQVDDSLTRRAKGTGLGLSITRHLVQMHGGVVDVRSELGKGSAFIVRLPVKQQTGGKAK